MSPSIERRKLSAILSADAQGFSRLMGADERHTVHTLTAFRQIFDETADAFGGRVVNAPGDAVLVEFVSVVDAVSAALHIQEQLGVRNRDLPAARQMHFRIGINLGDILQKGQDIYGDGVNIAARVEALAEGGGICITGSVFDQVKSKLDVGFEDLGEQRFKNIVEPVRVYRLVTGKDPADRPSAASSATIPRGEGAQSVCLAVLPFDDHSAGSAQNYFSEGIVEDLITDIAHFPSLQVISSYTSRKIGAGDRDALAVARELSIDYLLNGSLRRKGDHLRLSVQLLDTDTGGIVWADRYDEPVDRLFDLQDEIVGKVVGAISTQIDKVLLAAARKKPVTSLAAYDCWLRGMDLMRRGTLEADRQARTIFEQALALDPDYSRAYAGISLSYFNDWSCQLWDQWETTERNAYTYAMKALRRDDADYMVHAILGRILLYRRQFDLAEQHLDRALSLNANDADCLAQIATGKAFLGKAEAGEALFQKAMRLNPYRNIWYHPPGAMIYFVQRQYALCVETALKGPLTDVWVDLPGFMAAAYAHMGDEERAGHYLDMLFEAFRSKITAGHDPSPQQIADWMAMANPFRSAADRQHLEDGLIRAGLDCAGQRPVGSEPVTEQPSTPSSEGNRFEPDHGFWQATFEGRSVRIAELKGFYDLARLLAEPGKAFHCTDLMGSLLKTADQDEVIDAAARRSYEQHIRDLRDEIANAEAMNDLMRVEQLTTELDQLTDHLSKALGLGGRTRKVNQTAERARAAVTWRIRSAIRKIETAHPALGRHLANSVHTGTFCQYAPEKEVRWRC